jgi:hypothetical protein
MAMRRSGDDGVPLFIPVGHVFCSYSLCCLSRFAGSLCLCLHDVSERARRAFVASSRRTRRTRTPQRLYVRLTTCSRVDHDTIRSRMLSQSHFVRSHLSETSSPEFLGLSVVPYSREFSFSRVEAKPKTSKAYIWNHLTAATKQQSQNHHRQPTQLSLRSSVSPLEIRKAAS